MEKIKDVIAQFSDKCIIIKIKQKMIDERDGSVYETARQYWANNIKKAAEANYVLVIHQESQGKVIAVYKPDEWHDVTEEYMQDQKRHGRSYSTKKRVGFIGAEADMAVKKKYEGRYVPDYFSKSQACFRYTY
jgi:hypothetical protein